MVVRKPRLAVARALLLLFACAAPAEHPQLHMIAFDGGQADGHAVDVKVAWGVAFAAVDIDLDGDDEILVSSAHAVGYMGGDGKVTALSRGDVHNASWSTQPSGDAGDLVLWTTPFFRENSLVTHATCTLGDAPTCTLTGDFLAEGLVSSATAGDFDEDGRVDVVAWGDALRLYRRTKDDVDDPGWVKSPPLLGTATSSSRDALVAADLDDDGHLDLAVAAEEQGVRLLLGRGNSVFDLVDPRTSGAAAFAESVQLVDIDGQPPRELVTSAPTIIRRLRDRTFVESGLVIESLGDAAPQWLDAVPGDFDGDGRDELALLDLDGSVEVADLDGAPRDWTIARPHGAQWLGLDALAADFDGDGRAELVTLVPVGFGMECSIGGRARE